MKSKSTEPTFPIVPSREGKANKDRRVSKDSLPLEGGGLRERVIDMF
jgi:hypothetical protein